MRTKMMTTKALYICIGVLLVIIIAMSIYVIEAESAPICDRFHYYDNMQLWGITDAVPDPKTALKIAELYFDALSRFPAGYMNEVEVNLNSQTNEWVVTYSIGGAAAARDMHIYIKRDSGMITK